MSAPKEFNEMLEHLAVVRRHGLDLHAREEDGERYIEVEDSSDLEFLEGRDFTWLMRQEGLLEALYALKMRGDELWEFLRGMGRGGRQA